jgi:hypothetical protein
VGNLNESHVVNFNGNNNNIDVMQSGDENVAVLEASADDNVLTTSENEISIAQTGFANDAVVVLSTILSSNANTIDIAQNGELNSLDILVEGSNHEIGIEQIGDENLIYGTDGGAMLIGGDNIAFNISQVGNGNVVEGSFISDSGVVSITQMGDWNSAVIVQQ